MFQVNLDTGQMKNWGWAAGKASVLSEFGTMQLEFEYVQLFLAFDVVDLGAIFFLCGSLTPIASLCQMITVGPSPG